MSQCKKLYEYLACTRYGLVQIHLIVYSTFYCSHQIISYISFVSKLPAQDTSPKSNSTCYCSDVTYIYYLSLDNCPSMS